MEFKRHSEIKRIENKNVDRGGKDIERGRGDIKTVTKEKTAEPKITFVETGKIQLNIRVPNIFPKNIPHIVRDIRKTLESCASLNLLDEFAETRIVEYEEVLPEGAE